MTNPIEPPLVAMLALGTVWVFYSVVLRLIIHLFRNDMGPVAGDALAPVFFFVKWVFPTGAMLAAIWLVWTLLFGL